MSRRIFSLALLCVLALTGCSFSKNSRDQRAYQKYISKQSGRAQKQSAQFRGNKSKMPPPQMPSEPVESTSTGPEAVSSGSEQ